MSQGFEYSQSSFHLLFHSLPKIQCCSWCFFLLLSTHWHIHESVIIALSSNMRFILIDLCFLTFEIHPYRSVFSYLSYQQACSCKHSPSWCNGNNRSGCVFCTIHCFLIGCFNWFRMSDLLMEYLLQADTFDEELKKLVGMGFEKVFQALSFSISVPYSSHLAYGAGTAYCMFWLYLVFFFWTRIWLFYIKRSFAKWFNKQIVCFPYWLCVFTCLACFWRIKHVHPHSS